MQLELDGEVLLAPDRVDLLKAIDETGSITQAAQKVGLSYKAAWEAVDAIGKRADEPVVARVTGGTRGGGTTLTEYGRRLLALVQRLEQEQRAELARTSRSRAVSERPALRTSARNHWVGRIQALQKGAVKTEVRMALDPRRSLVAQITTASAEQLALARGMVITALVKASAITVDRAGGSLAQRAPNLLRGVIAAASAGEDRVELTVRVSKNCSVVALVRKNRTSGDLCVGTQVELSFAPESVLLVVPT